MQHDELIWQVIGHGHCSHRAKIARDAAFCRSEYNVTGLCNRPSCPLANSKYATVREIDGKTYLYMKTIERAHSPKNLWERVQLSKNYIQALQQIDEQLAYWPSHIIHRNKQRLTKIVQYLIRMRRMEKYAEANPVIETVNKKTQKREAKNETKALKAAELEKNIEKELLARLKQGTYGDIYNFPQAQFSKVLDEAEIEEEDETEDGAKETRRNKNDEEEDEDEDYDSELEDAYQEGMPGLAEFIEAVSDDSEDESDYATEYVDGIELSPEEQAEYDALVAGSSSSGEDIEDYGGKASKSKKDTKPGAKRGRKSVSFQDEDEEADELLRLASEAAEERKKRSKKDKKTSKAASAARKAGKPYLEIEYEEEGEQMETHRNRN